jgi:hypothetical protein
MRESASFSYPQRQMKMRGRHSTLVIQMEPQTRALLQQWLHRQKTPVGLARRAHALLLLEQGQTNVSTA